MMPWGSCENLTLDVARLPAWNSKVGTSIGRYDCHMDEQTSGFNIQVPSVRIDGAHHTRCALLCALCARVDAGTS